MVYSKKEGPGHGATIMMTIDPSWSDSLSSPKWPVESPLSSLSVPTSFPRRRPATRHAGPMTLRRSTESKSGAVGRGQLTHPEHGLKNISHRPAYLRGRLEGGGDRGGV